MSKSRPEPEATTTGPAAAAAPATGSPGTDASSTGSPAPGSPGTGSPSADSAPADSLAADPSGADSAGADEAGADVPEFTNRAARRAKGSSAGKPQSFAKGQRPVGRGAVQSPRQYGTRRSG
jgi:hypothetical protein